MNKQDLRIYFVLGFFFLFAGAISVRLFYLQALKGDFYKALAIGQQQVPISAQGQRGKIMAHDEKELAVLATSREFKYAYAVPMELVDYKDTARQVSQAIGLEYSDLEKKFSNKQSQYAEIKRKLSQVEIDALNNLQVKGLYIKGEFLPYYPFSNLAANVLGYVDKDGNGKYGLQNYYDDKLRPREGFFSKEKGLFGLFTPKEKQLFNGSDLVLTLDVNIQKKIEEYLNEAAKEMNFEGAQVVVLDPNNGKILAMANYPGYDPNDYSKYAKNMEVFQTGAVQKIYEPGSVFKALTMAVTLDAGKITPTTTYVDTGTRKFAQYTIANYDNRVWGRRTMTEALERSINTGMIFAEELMPHQDYYNYLEKFGLFRKTGVDIGGEIFSANPHLKEFKDVDYATISFGQGISMTPLRLAVTYAALVNGGTVWRPFIVEKIIKPNGEISETKPKAEKSGIISKKASDEIKMMLNSVTEKGYSQRARVPGYYIGGKTGTAQMPGDGGYSKKTWHTFAGVGSIFDPKFVIIVKLDNPQRSEASLSALPIFQKIADYMFAYLHISPDREQVEIKLIPVE